MTILTGQEYLLPQFNFYIDSACPSIAFSIHRFSYVNYR